MTATEISGRVDLTEHGIDASGAVYRNPTTSLLYTHALLRGDGKLGEGGPLVVDTGTFTGRSPKDKFLVDEPSSTDRIWWGEVEPEAVRRITTTGCARRSRRISPRPTRSTSSTRGPAPTRRTGSACASSPRTRTTRSSRARCSSTSGPRSSRASCRRRSCCTRPTSKPIRPRTARAPARSSSCIRGAPSCSSAARTTPARSRSRSSR